MEAKKQSNLSEQQKLSVYSAFTFAQAAVIYLKACLPVVREEDATQLQSLIMWGELVIERLKKHFPEDWRNNFPGVQNEQEGRGK